METCIILLVDDEPILLEGYKDRLEMENHTVFTATSGQEAIEILKNNPQIEAMFVDWIMGGMNGGDVVLTIKTENINPQLVIFVNTGGIEHEQSEHYIVKNYPVQGYRHKTAKDLPAAVLCAKRISNVIKENMLNAQLAYEDSLTELPNKRSLIQNIDLEINKVKRNKRPLSLVMLDIDHFKKFNDTYGHDVGDVVLKTVAQVLKKSVRLIDFIGRYGGEEFTVLLPETPLEGAKIVAERIRYAVENTEITVNDKVLNCTISLGIAELVISENETKEATMLASELLKHADDLLYKAKQNGRNRVESDL